MARRSSPHVTPAVQQALGGALTLARQHRHEYVQLEHLLLTLLDDEAAAEALEACGADLATLRHDLHTYLKDSVPTLPGEGEYQPEQTEAFKRVIARALRHILSCQKNILDAVDLLVAITEERQSYAQAFLEPFGITRLELVRYLSHGRGETPPGRGEGELDDDDLADDSDDAPEDGDEDDADGARDDDDGAKPAAGDAKNKQHGKALAAYTLDLCQLARDGKLDPLVGREREVRMLMRTLCRRRKNNPLLVGEPGVGKTAIVEGLAQLLVSGKVPEPLQGGRIYALDLGGMLAGTRYRGDFEERLKAVLADLQRLPGSILFMDEFHTIVGAGAVQGGSMDASNILKPVLSSGAIRCIGATTFSEYRNHVEKDRALMRRFQRLDVTEPSVPETISILQGLRTHFEKHYGVVYTQAAVAAAARLAARYMNDRFLPDKAVDVLDEAGAARAMLPAAQRRKTIGVRDVEVIVAEFARLPPARIDSNDRERLLTLENDLRAVIFGQDEAIHKVARAIKLARAGLRSPDKPIGSFLFCGPTGVGKTELSKQLAQQLGMSFIRFDMSEYAEKHTVARLVGAPPGYVGFDQGGQLTEAVLKSPHAVLLLDEIEKAHPDIYNVLLQVMDYGMLTDSAGRKADCRNVILIMTSNVGARELAAGGIGFQDGGKPRAPGDNTKALERTFAPEFRNRLDAIIHFHALTLDLVELIVDKVVAEVGGFLAKRKVTLELTPAARRWLAEKGFDPRFGARPVARLVRDEIQEKLVDELLFGALAQGGTVRATVADDKLVLTTQPATGATKLPPPSDEADEAGDDAAPTPPTPPAAAPAAPAPTPPASPARRRAPKSSPPPPKAAN